jgi:hypothetical protein
MSKLIVLAAAILGALTIGGSALATAPDREVFKFPYSYVDTDTCGFAIAVEGVFTNMIIDTSLATGTGTLELHQSDVATLTANGVTLSVDDHYTIFVTWVDGIATSAKHVGVLDNIIGPNGDHIFFRTGQAVYEVVRDPDTGFFVDGPLVTRHGLRDNFDAARFCGAFA